MIKKAFRNSVYLQRIHDEYILDMYTKKVCKQQNIFVKPIKSHSMSSGPEQCGRPSQILMKFGTVVGLLTL